jgi:hypothetical protein
MAVGVVELLKVVLCGLDVRERERKSSSAPLY